MKIFIVLFLLLTSQTIFAMDGMFEGEIKLVDQELPVPIKVDLKKTGTQEVLPNGDIREVLEGSFRLAGENISYSFSKVIINLNSDWVELSYNRQDMNLLKNGPDLRFFMKRNSSSSFAGNVYSSRWGKIGLISLWKVENFQPSLVSRFEGVWGGTMTREGEAKEIKIRLASRGGEIAVNPPDFELHETPNKVASVQLGESWFRLNNVHIDLLRNTLVLSQIDQSKSEKMVFELKFDPVSKSLTGSQIGIWSGDKAVVELNYISEGRN